MSDEVARRDGLYGMEFRDHDLRRVSEGEERKTYDIKSLWQRNHEIINLAVRGYKQTQIAEILNVCPATVSNTLNGELGKRKLSELRQEADEEAKITAEKIRTLTNKALATYQEILDNESAEATIRDRKDVSDTVLLELSGLRAPTKHISATLSAEEIEAFKNRGKALEEDVIDAEASETGGK